MAPAHLIRRTLSERVADELREQIRLGAITPGSHLRQVEVAERFGVSSTPVREAFSLLEREGLVVSAPHRGVVVFHPTQADLSETYEIRMPLEVLATRKAAAQVTDEELRSLSEIVDVMRASAGNSERYIQLNRDFHETIYAAARRPRLAKVIAGLRDASSAYLRLLTALTPTAEQSQRDHEAILAALQARDGDRAGDAMARHLQHTVDQIAAGLTADAEATIAPAA